MLALTIGLAVLLGLLGIELATRCALFGLEALRHPLHYSAQRIGQTSMVRAETDTFRLAANISGYYKGRPFSTNSHGFRGRETGPEKPTGVVRIAVLGRSYTMGHGVADDETWPARLEERLNGELSGGFEVLNLAVAGHEVHDMVALYNARWQAFAPDVVVLEASTRDLFTTKRSLRVDRHPALSVETLVGRSFFVSTLRATRERLRLGRWLLPDPAQRDAARAAMNTAPSLTASERRHRQLVRLQRQRDSGAAVIARFASELRRDGKPLVLVRLTPLHALRRPSRLWMPGLARAWLEAHRGTYWFDTQPWLQGRADDTDCIYYGDSHPNARVQALYADAIFDQLRMVLSADPSLRAVVRVNHVLHAVRKNPSIHERSKGKGT